MEILKLETVIKVVAEIGHGMASHIITRVQGLVLNVVEAQTNYCLKRPHSTRPVIQH